MNKAPQTPAQIEQKFNHMRADNKVNDKVTQIPGYQLYNKSKSYLMRIQSIKGVTMPKQTDSAGRPTTKIHDEMEITAELHMSFFYRDMKTVPEQKFFFGRTARSSKMKLRLDKGQGNTYSTDEKDVQPLYFHSSLAKTLEEASQKAARGVGGAPEVFLVFELVVAATDTGKRGESQVFSGGYGTSQIFQLSTLLGGDARSKTKDESHGAHKIETVTLAKGSPRDLLALVESKGRLGASDAFVSMILTEDYKRFDDLQKLIPGECIITREAVIPGLVGECFPVPDKDVKKDNDAKYSKNMLSLAKPINLFIHNIEVVGSRKVEDFMCKMLASMYVDKKASGRGLRQDPSEIHVRVTERKINVMVHNSWQQVCGETRSSTLQRPDEHGVFAAGTTIEIKEYVPHPLNALVFELQFRCSIQELEEKVVCLGYQISLPELNSIGSLVARDIELKLVKGPGESLTGTLLFSESTADENLLDFAVRAYVTTSQSPPGKEEISKRSRSIKSLNNKPAPSPRTVNKNQMPPHDPYKQWSTPNVQNQNPNYPGPPIQQNLPEIKINPRGKCETNWHDPKVVTKGPRGELMLPPGHPFDHRNPNDVMPYPGEQYPPPGYDPRYPQRPIAPGPPQYPPQHINSQYSNQTNQGHNSSWQNNSNHGSAARPFSPNNSHVNQTDPRFQQQNPMSRPGSSHDQSQFGQGYEFMQDPQVQNMMRLLQTQKDQMTSDQTEMKQFMQTFMDKMINFQEADRRSGPGKQTDPRVQPNDEMRQISNVLCNLLGMIGSQKGDERIIGLSEDLKRQVQSRHFDQLFNDNVPYAGFEKINLLKVSDMSTKDQANLIKQGLGDLLHHPSAQILSSGIIKNKIDMDVEENDAYKANTIKVKFLAFKTPLGHLGDVPKRFFFKMRFFTFPPIQTDALRLKTETENAGNFVMLNPGTLYLLEKSISIISMGQGSDSTNPHLEVSFNIDPSESKIINEHMKLANYLKERYLTIDLFDVKSKFFYGSCKVPLFELLRQGKQQMVRTKECEIFNPENSTYKGFLQIALSNEGKKPAVQEITKKTGKQPGQGQNNKKVTSRPMDLVSMQQASMTAGPGQSAPLNNSYQSHDHNATLVNQLSQTQFQASMNDPNLRKKLRVDRIRKMTAGATGGHGMSSIINDSKQPDWAKHNQIQQIDMIRQAKKHLIIKEVMGNYLSDSQQITVIPGEFSFLEVPLENTTMQSQSYSATISDPDHQLLEVQECTMVRSQTEFQHWIDAGKIKQQPLHCLTDENSNTIFLKPTEKIVLLFKFLTTREVSSNVVEATCDYIKQRSVKISFVCDTLTSKQVEVNLIPLHPPVDHVFRYNEPEHSYFKVRIPPFLQFPQKDVHFGISKMTAQVSLDPKTQAIDVSSKTHEALNVVDLTVFIWSGAYRSNLLATIKVEVTPLACIYSQTKAGVQNTLSLNLPVQNARQVEIHSSKAKNVYLPERSIMNKFNVIPNSINFIQVQTKTYCEKEQRVVVNAIEVDAHDRSKLVYSWLLILASQAPQPTQIPIDMMADMSTQTTGKIQFANKFRREMLFEIASSRDDVLVPTEKLIKYSGLQKSYIEFTVYPQGQQGTIPVFLYIGDHDQYVMECIQINIRFLNERSKAY